MSNCSCQLCGPCLARAAAQSQSYANAEQPQPSINPTEVIQHSYGIPDSTIVYILGKLKDKLQLDIYSGVNGYHIRTIPGNRWNNPVFVGSGIRSAIFFPNKFETNNFIIGPPTNIVVIIDRFNNLDLIRVTDEWGGTATLDYNNEGNLVWTTNGFDEQGFPLKNIDWPGLLDIEQILTPIGTTCTGVKIMPSDGLLVAGIDYKDGTFNFLRDTNASIIYPNLFPLSTTYGNPITGLASSYEILRLPAPFDTIGTPVGAPVPVNDSSDFGTPTLCLMAAQSSIGPSVVLFDYIQGTVLGYLGLDVNSVIISVTYSNQIITALLAPNTDPTNPSQIVRAFLSEQSYLMSGISSDEQVQGSQIYTVSNNMITRDIYPVSSKSINDINTYLGVSGNLDSYQEGNLILQLDSSTDPNDIFTPVTPATDSITASHGRIQVGGQNLLFYSGSNIPVPIAVINIPPKTNIVNFDSVTGTIAELYNNTDPTIEQFLILSNSHYEWVAKGGFTYGCSLSGETLTNGASVSSISVDRSVELGFLDLLPDLSIVIYDYLTGLIIYRNPKPLGYNFYGGNYITFDFSKSTVVNATSCTGILSNEATNIDGIGRTSNNDYNDYYFPALSSNDFNPEQGINDPIPVAAWNNTLDLDFPWQSLNRAISNSQNIFVIPVLKSWTTIQNGTTNRILPWWETFFGPLPSPLSIKTSQHLFYPPLNPEFTQQPTFSTEAFSTAGFFDLGLPITQTTLCDQEAAEIADDQAQLLILQNSLSANNKQLIIIQNKLSSDPTNKSLQLQVVNLQNQIVDLDNQIDSLKAEIASLQAQYSTCNPSDPDNVRFEVTRTIQKMNIGPMDKLNPQIIDPIDSTYSYILPSPISPNNSSIWSTINNINTPFTTIVPGSAILKQPGVPNTLPVLDPTLKTGIIVDPGIRTWIDLNIKLDRFNSVLNDGQAFWSQSETRQGRLGLNVGAAIPTDVLHSEAYVYPFCGGIIPGYVYDAVDIATGGAIGSWEITILLNNKPINQIATQVTFDQQIIEQAPTDLQQRLLSVFGINGGGVDPIVGMNIGKVYWSNEEFISLEINVKLVNYAFDVIRAGAKTKQYLTMSNGKITGFAPNTVQHDNITGVTVFRYGADPGYDWGNDCEAFCFGNLTCGQFENLNEGQLCANDPIDSVVRNVLWEGTAVYTIPDTNNPYKTKNLAIGKSISAFFNYNLNGGNFQYNIDLRHGEGRTQRTGNCS